MFVNDYCNLQGVLKFQENFPGSLNCNFPDDREKEDFVY